MGGALPHFDRLRPPPEILFAVPESGRREARRIAAPLAGTTESHALCPLFRERTSSLPEVRAALGRGMKGGVTTIP